MKIFDFKEFKICNSKTIGIESGGIYIKEDILYMIKFMNVESTLNEYIGSNLAKFLSPNCFPEVSFVKNGSNIVVASKFINNFTTFSNIKEKYSDIKIYGDAIDVALFVGHADMHFDNVGLIHHPDNSFEYAVVDFSIINHIPYFVDFKGMNFLFGDLKLKLSPQYKNHFVSKVDGILGKLESMSNYLKAVYDSGVIDKKIDAFKDFFIRKKQDGICYDSFKKIYQGDKLELISNDCLESFGRNLVQLKDFDYIFDDIFTYMKMYPKYLINPLEQIIIKSHQSSFDKIWNFISNSPDREVYKKAVKLVLQKSNCKANIHNKFEEIFCSDDEFDKIVKILKVGSLKNGFVDLGDANICEDIQKILYDSTKLAIVDG